MRKSILACLAPLALIAGSAASAPAGPVLSAEDAVKLARVEARGRLIYAYDRAAWLGTDDMLAKLPDAANRVGGWLVEGPADAPLLLFYDRDEADPHILYRASFAGGKLAGRVVSELSESRVSPARKALIDATRTARRVFGEARLARCSKASYNTVVLPPEQPGGPTLVYFLTPQTRNEILPFGGHYLIEVGADGRPSPPRPFSKSCLDMPISPASGAKAEMMVVSHILDPLPTEIHVFSSMIIQAPLLVVTTSNRKGWKIEHGAIRPFPLEGIRLPGDSAS